MPGVQPQPVPPILECQFKIRDSNSGLRSALRLQSGTCLYKMTMNLVSPLLSSVCALKCCYANRNLTDDEGCSGDVFLYGHGLAYQSWMGVSMEEEMVFLCFGSCTFTWHYTCVSLWIILTCIFYNVLFRCCMSLLFQFYQSPKRFKTVKFKDVYFRRF